MELLAELVEGGKLGDASLLLSKHDSSNTVDYLLTLKLIPSSRESFTGVSDLEYTSISSFP